MTKQYFQELAAYNVWANNIVCSWLQQITDEQWTQEIVSSFNTIQQTVLHIINAENAWLQRFKKIENFQWIQSTYKGTKDENIVLWKKTSEELKKFIDDFNEQELNTNFAFKRFNGEAYSMPYYQVFAHIINHAAYHRGQLVTMLRQAGFTNVQLTDLMLFYRK